MNKTENSESFLYKTAKCLGLAALASFLAGCYIISQPAQPTQAESVQRPKFFKVEESGTEKKPVQPVAPKEDLEKKIDSNLELGFRYTYQGNEDNASHSGRFSMKNRKDLGKLRWKLDMNVTDQDDAVDTEGLANGEFYANNSEQHGGGLGFRAGNKQLEGSAAGHMTLGRARISGNVFGGKRTDENLIDGIGTELDNDYLGAGLNFRFKLDRNNNLVLGGTYNQNGVNYNVTGLPSPFDGNIDTKAFTEYIVYSGNSSDPRGGSGYMGMIFSQIKMEGEDDNNDVNFIGGMNIRCGPRTSFTPRIMVGDQVGGGIDIIKAPDRSMISSLYSQLREVENTQGTSSEAYKNLARQIELTAESSNANIFSFSGQKDKDTNVENYEVGYKRAWGNGSKVGIDYMYTHIPEVEDEHSHYILLNGEWRLPHNQSIVLEFQIPVGGGDDNDNLRVVIGYNLLGF